MSLGKKIIFYLILWIGFPLTFLVLLETSLFVLDIADPYKAEDPYTGFKNYVPVFIEDPDNPDKLVINPRRAKWKVSPQKTAKAINVQWMDKNKADNGFRVMLFGGSNTFNFQPELHVLQERLQEALPDRKAEVINLGGNAYGSHRIVKLFEEVVNYDPDLLILYSGHNEFVEKRFYENILNEKPWLTSLKGFLGKFRFYILLRRVIRDVKSSSVGFFTEKDKKSFEKGRIMLGTDVQLDLVPYNKKDYYRMVMSQYEANLEKMARIAKENGVQVVFSTVASRDMTPPYAPCYNPELGEEGNKKLRDLMDKAGRILSAREFNSIKSYEERYGEVERYLEEAKPIIEQARSIWPEDGDVLYWSGFVKYFEKDYGEAKRLMLESLKNDCSPHRSTPRTNSIVRKVARGNGIPIVDVVSLIEGRSPFGISYGRTQNAREERWGLFFDHCHLNNIGRTMVMNLYADEIIENGWGWKNTGG